MPSIPQYSPEISLGSIASFTGMVGGEGLEVWSLAGVATLGALFHNGVLLPIYKLQEESDLLMGHC